MATQHTPADDIVYDLVTVQYHALTAAQATDKYLQDAQGHDDVRAFFEEVARQDAGRAQKPHQLLGQLTSKAGLQPAHNGPLPAGGLLLPCGCDAREKPLPGRAAA